MLRPRKALCTTSLLAALATLSLSGCANVQAPGAAAAQAGVLGQFVEQLKREDDEVEGQELAALREARQEQRERLAEGVPE